MTAAAGLRARAVPAVRQAIKGGAAALDVVRPPGPGITVLIYHRVGAGTGGQMDLSPAAFTDQLAWLVSTHRVLTLDAALAELADVAQQEPAVVVTFDDGTADWVDHVLPALDRAGVPATFYVATDFVDRQLPFPGDGVPLSWSGLAELASSELVTIGSHTHTHALLDRLAPELVADELDRSIDLLAEHIGEAPAHFAYPKALCGSPSAEAAVRERFRSAVLAGTHANRPGADPHRLARTPIQPSDGTAWFRRKVVGGLGGEDRLRATLNRVRHRSRST